MEREEGELLSRFKGRGGKERKNENTKSETPSTISQEEIKIVSFPGRVLLFWCFYSNSFYVPIFTNLQSYYYATCNHKKHKCQKQYDYY